MALRPFTRFTLPDGESLALPGVPPKTTFGGRASPEGRRITAYLEQIAPLVEPWRTAPATGLGMALAVGLPAGADLHHNDLDNYLEPLASRLGRGRLSFARATKAQGPVSTLALGSVLPATEPLEGWQFAEAGTDSLRAEGKRRLARQIAAQAAPLPWGPVELEIAIRVGDSRRWINAWKPVIDALVAILGRAPGASEFDIEDGRIVSLGLHRELDPSLGHELEVAVWWRAAAPLPAMGSGPALSYAVLDAELPARGRRSPAVRGGRRRPLAPPERWAELGLRLITSLDDFDQVEQERTGFVVITDSANPTRLHRVGCRGVKRSNFETKVVRNGMANGEYFAVESQELAEEQWPGVAAHGCV